MSTLQPSTEIIDTPKRDELLARAIILVAKANFDSGDPTSDMINLTVNICGTSVRTFTDHTLSLLCDPTLNTDWANTATKGIFSHWDNQMVSDYLSNAHLLQGDSAMTTTNNLNVIASYLRLLHNYKELAPTGAQHAAERAQQTAAILKVTLCIKAAGSEELKRAMTLDVKGDIREYPLPYINDAKLRTLLLKSTYDREAVISILTRSNIFDADYIMDVLDNISAPLIDGAL